MRPEVDRKPTLEEHVLTEIVENVLAEHRFIERSRNPYVANDNQRTYKLHPCFLYMIDPACSSGRLLVRQRRSAPTRGLAVPDQS